MLTTLALTLLMTAPAPSEDSKLEELANTCLQEMVTGKADALFQRFTPEMAAAIPREKNAAFIAGIQRDLGALKSSKVVSLQRRGPAATVVFNATLEKGSVLITLGFDEKQKLAGMSVKPAPVEDEAAARLDGYESRTRLSPPFAGEWVAINAARNASNPHFTNPNQRFAVDWLVMDKDGKTFRGEGNRREDYLCYGQDMLAPADGTVVVVVDGVPEVEPRKERDKYNVAGNMLVLDLGQGEYGVFAHAIPGSFKVKVGDKVKRGQALARVGNSGNTSEPHLHFQLANGPHLYKAQALPARFSDVMLNGSRTATAFPTDQDRMGPAVK